MTAGEQLSKTMAKVALRLDAVDEARRVMNSLPDPTAKRMWVSVWGIETCTRIAALLKNDPSAVVPEKWAPLSLS
jgi:hypothetical protein